MNRGNMLQSSAVQQLLAGGPNSLWSIMSTNKPSRSPSRASSQPHLFAASLQPHLFPHQLAPPYTHTQEFPDSLSKLLLDGSVSEEDKSSTNHVNQVKKLENWEEQLLHDHHNQLNSLNVVNGMLESAIKQENSLNYGSSSSSSSSYSDFHCLKPDNLSNPMIHVSSPNSCISNLTNNMLDFSTTTTTNNTIRRHPPPDRLDEFFNSSASGGASKKAKIQQSSNQSTFKVRKEKLGDRIATLHQIVSPFGKTDTASVLLEVIGYIRFLHTQIEALSLPYLEVSGSPNTSSRQHYVQQGKINNCLFPKDHDQLRNDNCMKMKESGLHQDSDEKPNKDLRSRGLCLVPVSCTMQVETVNGADYWAPALNGGFR